MATPDGTATDTPGSTTEASVITAAPILPADKAAADKAVADKAVADKAVADKTVTDAAAADVAEDVKLQKDMGSTDAAVKDAAKKRFDEKAAAKAEAAAKAKGDGAVKGAPEKYEPFNLAEGVTLDVGLAEAFMPVAKKHGLSQAAAQEFVDMYAAQRAADSAKLDESQVNAWKTTKVEWAKAGKDDTEVGGAQYDASVANAKHALKVFGRPGLKDALEITGAGDHPDFLHFMAQVGRLAKEHDLVPSGGSGAQQVDVAKKLFPNQN